MSPIDKLKGIETDLVPGCYYKHTSKVNTKCKDRSGGKAMLEWEADSYGYLHSDSDKSEAKCLARKAKYEKYCGRGASQWKFVSVDSLAPAVTNAYAKIWAGADCYLTYCNANPDLMKACCGGRSCASDSESNCCKQHWQTVGRKKKFKRSNPESCVTDKLQAQTSCYLTYCNANPDLMKAFCGGRSCASDSESNSCKRHWQTVGRSIRRTPNPDSCVTHVLEAYVPCYIAYCNAHPDLKKKYCGDRTCVVDYKEPTWSDWFGCYYRTGASRESKCGPTDWKHDQWGNKDGRSTDNNEASCLQREEGHSSWCKGKSEWKFIEQRYPMVAGCYYKKGASSNSKCGPTDWTPDLWGNVGGRSTDNNKASCLQREEGHSSWCKGKSEWKFIADSEYNSCKKHWDKFGAKEGHTPNPERCVAQIALKYKEPTTKKNSTKKLKAKKKSISKNKKKSISKNKKKSTKKNKKKSTKKNKKKSAKKKKKKSATKNKKKSAKKKKKKKSATKNKKKSANKNKKRGE